LFALDVSLALPSPARAPRPAPHRSPARLSAPLCARHCSRHPRLSGPAGRAVGPPPQCRPRGPRPLKERAPLHPCPALQGPVPRLQSPGGWDQAGQGGPGGWCPRSDRQPASVSTTCITCAAHLSWCRISGHLSWSGFLDILYGAVQELCSAGAAQVQCCTAHCTCSFKYFFCNTPLYSFL
jgi:hypothetical protein